MTGTRNYRVSAPRYGGTFSALEEPLGFSSGGEIELPYVVRGELVKVPNENADASRPAQTASIEIVESSPARVTPRCRHFGTCGGCQYQHMAADEQLRTKATLLEALLKQHRIGIPAKGIQAHAACEWHYRNRMRLRLDAGRVGYSRRQSNEFLPIQECPIVSPLLWQAAEHFQALHADWPSEAAEVEFFTTADEGALQISLHLNASVTDIDRSAPAQFRGLCEALRAFVPQLKGAGLLVHAAPATGASRRVQERQRIEIAKWGEPALQYRLGLHSYTVSRNAFFQVNRFLTEELLNFVLGSRTGALALDLYAGAGLFSVPLADRFSTVVSVEIGQPAAGNLAEAMRVRGPQHRTEQKPTLAFLKEWHRQRNAVPGLVILDPPRAGLGREVVAELLKLGADQIAYVSCDPNTFARDCRALVESRYLLEEVHLLDLFPQTFHMETVAVLRRR